MLPQTVTSAFVGDKNIRVGRFHPFIGHEGPYGE